MFNKKRNTLIKVELMNKTRDTSTNNVELRGNSRELFQATSDVVATLIRFSNLSINDVALAFKLGIEKAEELKKI